MRERAWMIAILIVAAAGISAVGIALSSKTLIVIKNDYPRFGSWSDSIRDWRSQAMFSARIVLHPMGESGMPKNLGQSIDLTKYFQLRSS